jgi:hypothetical protein
MVTALHTIRFFLLIAIAVLVHCSVEVSDSGSGTNVGNAKVTGIVCDQNGNPAPDVRALLLPVNHNPVADPVVADNRIDTTDSNGLYRFAGIDPGLYNIEAYRDGNTRLLIRDIAAIGDSAVTVPADMMKKTGALMVVLSSSITDGYLFIKGPTIKQAVHGGHAGNDTVIFHSIPAGKIPFVNLVSPSNITNPTVVATNVAITPDDTAGSDATGQFTVTAILLKETFDDSDLTAKGWYDDVNPVLSKTEHISGSISSLEYTFLKGDSVPSGGKVIRHLFTETDSVYLSFWVKYSKSWQGDAQHGGESAITFLTNKDSQFGGPWYNSLSVHVQQDSGKPVVYLTDPKNIDEANIGNDLTVITESRSVAGCNGDSDGYGPGECYPGGTCHSNYKPFGKRIKYFQDTPGKYYKNGWHFIELYLRLNTISNNKGIADGIIKYWYDGGLVMQLTHVMFRTAKNPDMKLNQIIMAPYIGVSPVDQTVWIDELTIAR